MLIIPIMLFISWLVGNNLWAYLALGLAVTGTVLNVSKKQALQKQLQQQQDPAAVTNAVNDFLKSIQAKLN